MSHNRVVTLVAHRVAKVGGMERAFAELAEGLLSRGYEVQVITRECDLPRHPKLRTILVYSPNRPFLLSYPLFLLRGSLATWRHRRGLVHVLGAIVLNSSDVATVQFCHHGFSSEAARARSRRSSPLYMLNAWVAHLLSMGVERLVYQRARVRWLITASNGIARELETHFPHFRGRRTTIPNGVDREVFRPDLGARATVRSRLELSSSALVAVFVGGDWERKGLRFAVQALADERDWHLVVVGSGSVERYAALARELEVDARVHFVGHQRDTASYFAAADAFLLPTAYEAFPLVMLEAAASGLPLLVTRVNGAEGFVEEGVTGFFIDRDGLQVAGELRRLAAMGAEERGTMGTAARAATERYTWTEIVESHVEIYERLAG